MLYRIFEDYDGVAWIFDFIIGGMGVIAMDDVLCKTYTEHRNSLEGS